MSAPWSWLLNKVECLCCFVFCKILKLNKVEFVFAEFFIYRIVFLIMGIVLLSLASRLSKSVAFYYIGAMSIGIVILVTLIINQGIKRLPTRGKSRFQLFFYSSMIGVGGYFLQYIRGLVQDLLMQIEISEDLYIPVSGDSFGCVCIYVGSVVRILDCQEICCDKRWFC